MSWSGGRLGVCERALPAVSTWAVEVKARPLSGKVLPQRAAACRLPGVHSADLQLLSGKGCVPMQGRKSSRQPLQFWGPGAPRDVLSEGESSGVGRVQESVGPAWAHLVCVLSAGLSGPPVMEKPSEQGKVCTELQVKGQDSSRQFARAGGQAEQP